MTALEWSAGQLEHVNALATLGVNLLAQTTLLISAGMVAARLCRRRGAALQSAILRAALVAALACPAASWTLSALGVPGFRVELPRAALLPIAAAPASATAPDIDTETTRWLEAADPTDDRPAGSPAAPASLKLAPRLAPSNPQSLANDVAARTGPAPTTADAPASSGIEPAPAGEPSGLAIGYTIAVLAWLAAAGALLGRLVVANLVMWRMCQGASRASLELAAECAAIAQRMNVAAPTVRVGSSAASPCLVGWWRPVILLPAGMTTISSDALAHELAHLMRRDCLWNFVAQLSVAVLPIQPLLWLLARRMEDAADEVCDDFVVSHTADRASYARELVDIAERFQPDWAAATAGVGIAAFRSSLGRRVLRILDTSRDLSIHTGVTALVLILLCGAAGVALAGLVGAARGGSAAAVPRPPDGAPAALRGDLATTEDFIRVRGRVLDPAGKPVDGATIYALGWYWSPDVPHAPLAESRSDAAGRFELGFPHPTTLDSVWFGHMSPERLTIAAVAPGYGTGFSSWADRPRHEEVTLKLAADDTPISGRVLDLEGRPVAGVKVSVLGVAAPKGDDLSDWLQAIRSGEVRFQAERHIAAAMPDYEPAAGAGVVTDAAGRFRVTGVGRERIATLLLEGPTIARNQVDVVTRRIEPLQQVIRAFDNLTRPLYGADLDIVAQPTRPIVGTVRDADTGRPLAGVTIANSSWPPGVPGHRLVRTVTDSAGRYRLTGLPKTKLELVAIPNDDQPYFMQEAAVADSPGFDPVTLDVELHRGIWITGRVTDKATGAPAPAHVIYFPFLSNEWAQKRTPEFGPHKVAGYNQRYTTSRDGTYRLVGLPGRAIVGAACSSRSYRAGVGAEAIEGLDEHGRFPTHPNNVWPGLKWPNSMKEIDPPEGVASANCDIELDPGETIRVTVVGPDGKPLTDYACDGSSVHIHGVIPIRDSSFDVANLGPNETRTVIIHHPGRGLGKVIRLNVAEHPTRAAKIALEPCAAVAGRLLTTDGDPVAGATVEFLVRPAEDFGKQLQAVTTDSEGRFRHAGVPSGVEYTVTAQGNGLFQVVAEQLSPKPGEPIDLGEVRLESRGEAERPEPNEVRSSRQGVENAPGSGEAEDKPLEGRIVDLQGKPIAGVTVRVVSVQLARPGANLDAWRAEAAKNPTHIGNPDSYTAARPKSRPKVAPFPAGQLIDARELADLSVVATDAAGRFQIRGLGRDRFVTLEFAGPTIARTWVSAVTRSMPAVPYPTLDSRFRQHVCFGSPFDYVAEPGRTMRGVVRDAESKEPLPGVTVDLSRLGEAPSSPADGFMRVVSDAQGRFELHGLPLNSKHTVRVVPTAEQPYFRTEFRLDAQQGQQPIELAADLRRAVWIGGRLVNRDTRAPVSGWVSYYPFLSNQYATRFVNFDPAISSMGDENRYRVGEDGSFRIPAIPGRGIVVGIAHDAAGYQIASGAMEIDELREAQGGRVTYGLLTVQVAHAVRVVEVAEDAADAVYDLELVPAARRRIALFDPDGEPLSGVQVTGNLVDSLLTHNPVLFRAEPSSERSVDVFGFDGKLPRTLVLLQPERALGLTTVLDGDGPDELPNSLTLLPCGRVSGRLLDSSGHPLGGKQPQLSASKMETVYGISAGGRVTATARPMTVPIAWIESDASGRFEFVSVPPGSSYTVVVQQKEFTTPVVRPGETIDLGDLRIP